MDRDNYGDKIWMVSTLELSDNKVHFIIKHHRYVLPIISLSNIDIDEQNVYLGDAI